MTASPATMMAIDDRSVDTIDKCRSYATRANLMAALEKLGFIEDRHMVVCNTAGRFTAVFPASNFKGGGYVGLYSSHGFMTFG